MASRPVIIASLLGASVGVPYLASHSQLTQTAAKHPAATAAAAPAQSANVAKATPFPVATSPSPAISAPVSPPANTPVSEGARFASVAQVLRFDVSKEWVCRNWPRKSVGPTDVGLFAIRVPLVMGTQMSALAGALTYYFNEQGQVEYISFKGSTGDTTPLVQFLTQSYHFQPVAAPIGAKVFQVRDDDGLHSELRLHPESVLLSNTPQQSIAVELEFARPGSPRVLPPHGPMLKIPQVASPPAAETAKTSSQGATSSVHSAAKSYFGQVRYATPAEESQLQRMRWPE